MRKPPLLLMTVKNLLFIYFHDFQKTFRKELVACCIPHEGCASLLEAASDLLVYICRMSNLFNENGYLLLLAFMRTTPELSGRRKMFMAKGLQFECSW